MEGRQEGKRGQGSEGEREEKRTKGLVACDMIEGIMGNGLHLLYLFMELTNFCIISSVMHLICLSNH